MNFGEHGVGWSSPERALDILVISRCPPWPLHLGDRLILYHLARNLEARRHNLYLLAFYQQPADLADVTFYDQFFREVELVREPQRSPAGYLGRRLFRGARFPKKAADCWSPEMWKLVSGKLEGFRYDVVHLFGGIAVYEYYNLVSRFPNVITPYESYSLYLEREDKRAASEPALQRFISRLRLNMARNYESWMFGNFDRVVMVSEKDAAVLRNLNSSTRLAVIPNGVDIDRFTPSRERGPRPVVIFTGNFDYPPNVDAAMVLAQKIFPAIRKRVRKARLILVGANPPPELQRLGKSKYVMVTGRVPDMRVYLDQATVYVSPLRRGAGIKNKILEAMAMAKPVVATPMSCDGIDVTDGENVFLAKQPSKMVERTVKLIKSRSLRERIGAAGRKLVESRYTWRYVVDQYETLYRHVMEKLKE